MKRMDRYSETTNRLSRVEKNQNLYQDVSNNAIYTNITDVTNANAFEIGKETSSAHQSRESYQQMQKFKNFEPISPEKKELEDYNHLYQKRENKVYDINSVLENARKNRSDKDELEEKRKLKNNAYNILSGVNKEELEKYREEKRKKILTPEEEEIRDLIDTIASKTLAGELDKETTVDLLSDLMATNMLDKVAPTKENPEIKEEVVEKTEEKKPQEEISEEKEPTKIEETKENSKVEKDTDFYTRSMDLSDKDFDMSDEFKDKTLPLWIKLLLFFLVVVVLSLAGIYIYQRFF